MAGIDHPLHKSQALSPTDFSSLRHVFAVVLPPTGQKSTLPCVLGVSRGTVDHFTARPNKKDLVDDLLTPINKNSNSNIKTWARINNE
jgi:hypothetical protein